MIVYKITNVVTGQAYIGITSRSLAKRFKDHKSAAKSTKQDQRRRLYAAMRKYGVTQFTIEEIGRAESWEALCALERRLIAEHRTFWRDGGYNLTRGGDGMLGFTHSEEARRKMAARVLGKKRSPEFCAAVREALHRPEVWAKFLATVRGRKQTPETIAKRAAALKGKKRSPEARAKIAAALKGKPKSAEHIARSAAARRGHRKTPEQIERSAAFHRGRKRSTETRAKISAGLTGKISPLRGVPRPPHVIEALRRANRGRKHTAGHIAKLVAARRATQERKRAAKETAPCIQL